MDGATLRIEFKDDSPQSGQGSPATTPQGSGANAPAPHVEDQQRAITQAGGVGRQAEQRYSEATTTSSASVSQPAIATAATVPVSAPLPTPVATSSQPISGEAGIAAAVQKIVAADPRATAEEIAKLLGGGVGVRQIERMMNPGPPPSEPIPNPPAQPRATNPSQAVDDLIFPADLRRVEADRWIESERQRFQQEAEEESARQRQQQEAAARNIPRPPPLTRDQILAETERNAPPVQNQPLNVTSQVQTTVNAISHFAHMAGPLGSAVAGVANTAVALPGVAQAIGAAAPGLVAAAPYVAIAAAAAAIPAAAVSVVTNEANRAISVSRQFSAEVVGAEAQADVRQVLADMRSARVVGDEAAQLVDARSRARTALQGVRDRISEPILEDFAQFNNAVAKFADLINNATDESPFWRGFVRGFSGAATDEAGTAAFGPAYWIYKLTGNIFGSPPEDSPGSAGLMGIVPIRPDLPAPFNEDNSSRVQRITTKGLPSLFSPGSK